MSKKKKSAFDIINDPEDLKATMVVGQIIGAFIKDVAIPLGMKKADYMMICEEMWNMCPHIDHAEKE